MNRFLALERSVYINLADDIARLGMCKGNRTALQLLHGSGCCENATADEKK